MKNALVLTLSLVLSSVLPAAVRPLVVDGAPFPLTVNEFTPPERDFVITDFGAAPGRPATEAIERAIAAAAGAGGGRVVFPKGEWLSGAFKMKSNVALVVDAGSTLRFPDDPVVVYRAPVRPNGRPTATQGGLIVAQNCTNVAILGRGTLTADVGYWHRNFLINPKKGFPRPQFFSFHKCRNIRFEGFRIRGSPAWTMHFCVCDDIVLRDLDSSCTGPNTDGLDLESCNRALVERVSLDQTDDTFTIKSGMNETGRRRNIPTQNVVIRQCRAVHGHSLLGIGSEVSGGIRNIYMTDCEVTAECWNWLFVKTNAKRGAFVENVTLENIRGNRASSAVMNVEMYYDGNPNKELRPGMASPFPTRITNIVCRNITCTEAGTAVKVRGDATRPPRGLVAENITVGYLRDPKKGKLVSAKTAPDLVTRGIRLDPKAGFAALPRPAHMRLGDAAHDAEKSVTLDRTLFEDLSDATVMRRVLNARIAAECRLQRHVAPAVAPADTAALPPPLEGGHVSRMQSALGEWGCAVPGFWTTEAVRAVARADADGRAPAFPGVTFRIFPDERNAALTVRLVNGGATDLADGWCTVYLPATRMTRRQAFALPTVRAGETFEKRIDLYAGAHYMPRAWESSAFAAHVDVLRGGVRARLWQTADVPVTAAIRLPVETARATGPMDALYADGATLAKISASAAPLDDFPTPGGAWRAPRFDGAAWYDVTGARRAYTEGEQRLVHAGRACEVVALAFEGSAWSTNALLRLLSWTWDKAPLAYLNGAPLKIRDKVTPIAIRPGRNQLVVRFASKPGREKACAQIAAYTWSVTDHLPCLDWATSGRVAAPHAPVAEARFPLEWNVRYATGVPYEVEISRAKLARLAGTAPDTGLTALATGGDGAERALETVLLPARDAASVRLRFTVPPGTASLAVRAAASAPVADPNGRADNLLKDALTHPQDWKVSPKMSVSAAPAGGLVFAAKDFGEPEASWTVPVPADWAGAGVVFEALLENRSTVIARRIVRVEQLDRAGALLPESVVDRRWTAHVCPTNDPMHYLEEGRIHRDAAFVRVLLKIGAPDYAYDLHGLPRSKAARRDRRNLTCHRLARLSLRRAAVLPFPKYDAACFTQGVSGERGDTALVLGGEAERCFWYQTRSNASWSDRKQLRAENLVFFPSQAGTVEAYFKSAWKPLGVRTQKGAKVSHPYTLFDAYHGFKATEHLRGEGSLVTLSYLPEPGALELRFREPTEKKAVWQTRAPVRLAVGAWSHVALQWTPRQAAEVFVNGRRVLSLPIPGWKGCDLADASVRVINDANAHELFVGSACASARLPVKIREDLPLFEGAVDLVRVSTGLRYRDGFTPARTFACDADTRALFAFDASFDGVSGGGLGWIPGTYRALADRIDHTLAVNGGTVGYWPKMPLVSNDPRCVFDIVNYPKLPTPADFEALRRPFRHTATLKPAATFAFEAPAGSVTDYVEIRNVSDAPLAYPILLNAGDVDPRSFGDLRDTLNLAGLAPRERVNRVFQYVLSAADYYPQHTATFPAGSDRPRDVEYDAFTVLNGYCGFECGPMNHLAQNLFAAVAGCASSGNPGYAHQFEQVFFEGKNHVYDLSAQKFFPAWDNETSAYLRELGDQPGLFTRYGMTGDHFIRKSDRGFGVFALANVPKIGVTLNPGEAFRVWQYNDGQCNDLLAEQRFGPWRGSASKEKREMDAETHADTEKVAIRQVNRFFPHYLNGFLTYAGGVSAANPAFRNVTPTSFCYHVSSGYPIVAGNYAAETADGTRANVELSTDFGKTFRPFPQPATYSVRGRCDYLVRVSAAPAAVTRFTATTEVQINPRTFPGRIRAGANRYTLKAVSGGAAEVTVAGRASAGRLTVTGRAVYAGTVIGAEQLFTAFDAAETRTLKLAGVSPDATAAFGGAVTGALEKGTLSIRARAADTSGFGTVTVADRGAARTITCYTAPGVRFATAEDATVTGKEAALLAPDATSPQRRGVLTGHCAEGFGLAFHFAPAPAGRYAVFNVNRFAAHPEPKAPFDLRMKWRGQKESSHPFGAPRNEAINFWKANYARPGERANFKWDFGARLVTVPAGDTIDVFSWRRDPVEVAAILAIPEPDRETRAELLKRLCGFNTVAELAAE